MELLLLRRTNAQPVLLLGAHIVGVAGVRAAFIDRHGWHKQLELLAVPCRKCYRTVSSILAQRKVPGKEG